MLEIVMDDYTKMYGPVDLGDGLEVSSVARRVKVDWIEFNGGDSLAISKAGVLDVFHVLGGKADGDTTHFVVTPESGEDTIDLTTYQLLDVFIEALHEHNVSGWSFRCNGESAFDDSPWFDGISDLIDRLEHTKLLEDLQDAEFRIQSTQEQFDRLAAVAGIYVAATMREGWEKGPTEGEALSNLSRTLHALGIDPHRILDEWSNN
jgi:hypothetical protein